MSISQRLTIVILILHTVVINPAICSAEVKCGCPVETESGGRVWVNKCAETEQACRFNLCFGRNSGKIEEDEALKNEYNIKDSVRMKACKDGNSSKACKDATQALKTFQEANGIFVKYCAEFDLASAPTTSLNSTPSPGPYENSVKNTVNPIAISVITPIVSR